MPSSLQNPRQSLTAFYLILFFLSAPFALWAQTDEHEEWKPFRVVLHVHSKISGDDIYLEEIGHQAQRSGIDTVIMTEYFQQKVSWGFYPFHRFLKVSHEKPSAIKYGLAHYAEDIRAVNQNVPEVLFLAGVEVTPFYWWSGSLWKGDWTVHDVQKNLLVFGLTPEDLKRLPTLENGDQEFDPYHGPKGSGPYQKVIDYAEAKSGLSIWSTPDEAYGADSKVGPVRLSTPPYADALPATYNYTGVGIFPEGYVTTGVVGGLWDKMLGSYCRGKRDRPLWGFSEVVIHKAKLKTQLGQWDNIVYAAANSPEEILEAMKKGRFYIRRVEQDDMVLGSFVISDTATSASAFLGEEIEIHGQPELNVLAALPESAEAKEITLEIIRDGEVAHTEKAEMRLEVNWIDSAVFEPGTRHYYRIALYVVLRKHTILLSNPIFVTVSNQEPPPLEPLF